MGEYHKESENHWQYREGGRWAHGWTPEEAKYNLWRADEDRRIADERAEQERRSDRERSREASYSYSGPRGPGMLAFAIRTGITALKSVLIRPIATVFSAVTVAAFWVPVHFGLPFVVQGGALDLAQVIAGAVAVLWTFAAAEYFDETEGKVFCPGLKGPSFFGFVRLQLGYILTIGLVLVASELLLPYLFRLYPKIPENVPVETIQLGLVAVAIGYRYFFHPVLRYFDWKGNIRPDPAWKQRA